MDIELNSWIDWLKPKQAPDLFRLTDSNRSYLRQWLPGLDTCQKTKDSAYLIENATSRWEPSKGLILGIW